MSDDIYLHKLHCELLDIMSEIDRLCSLYGLRYYLVGGTLLGAIRHKGFIPWDDDLDIAMPRDHFERFISIANDRLNSCFELQWITTNAEYWQVFGKVCRKGTLFKEPGLKKFNPTGIFVDIFPLDISSSFSPRLENKKKWIGRISTIIWTKNSCEKGIRHFLQCMIASVIPTSLLQKIMIRIMKGAKRYGTSHYVNFGSQYKLVKQTMPTDWYGDGIVLQFENRKYKAPVEYDKVLKSIYGPNYMDIPPKEKRRCHYPEKVVFSDGVVMDFDVPEHIVTIAEQNNSD